MAPSKNHVSRPGTPQSFAAATSLKQENLAAVRDVDCVEDEQGDGPYDLQQEWRVRASLVVLLIVGASLLASPAFAEDRDEIMNPACANKNQYTIFNPTPTECLREYDPDRPDQTDGPSTIDAGHVALETDLANYALSNAEEDGTLTEKLLFGATDIRVGLTNNLEVDVLVQPINALKTRSRRPSRTDWAAGPDTLEVGARYVFFGQDTFDRPGATALGIRSFIEVPTVRNGVGEEDVAAGFSGLFALKVSEKVEFEAMSEIDLAKSENGSDYLTQYFNTVSLSYEWTPKISFYGDIATLFGEGDSPKIIMLGTGVWYRISENLVVDFGSNFGVTRDANPFNPWIGISKRF